MWRDFKVGQRLVFKWKEFDGKGTVECVVKEVHYDFALAYGDGMRLRIDEDTVDMFEEVA